MPYPKNARAKTGMFVPTTNVWNATSIEQIQVGSPDFKKLLVDLYQNINNIALALNAKDTGTYTLQPFIPGNLWYLLPDRNKVQVEYRKVINFGPLGVATKSVAHGIVCTTATQFVEIYACASKTTAPFSYLPIPYASSVDVAHNIEISVDDTNVTISNGIDRSMYDKCVVVLRYLLS